MKLEIGYNSSFEVRTENYDSGSKEKFTVLYISDFHFTRFSQNITTILIDKIRELNPDIVLLGGDYADSKKGLEYLNKLMFSLSQRKNVFAIAGNHDYFFGLAAVKKIMTENNAVWIEKSSFTFQFKKIKIQIDGTPQKEKSAADFSILCLHKPVDIEEYANNYQLVFAGHLHGSQVVLWETKNGLFPGRLFYKWNRLKIKVDKCAYFISKGMGDTLPLRYNCKKDLIFINVE